MNQYQMQTGNGYEFNQMQNQMQFGFGQQQMGTTPMFYGTQAPAAQPYPTHMQYPTQYQKPGTWEDSSTVPPASPPGLGSPWSVPSPQDEVSTAFDSNEWNHPSLLSSPDVSGRYNQGAPMSSPYGMQFQQQPKMNQSPFGQQQQGQGQMQQRQQGPMGGQQGGRAPVKVVEKGNNARGNNQGGRQERNSRGKIVTAASNGQLYKTKLCYYHVHGTCSWGESCHHAHSLEELKPKPDLTKTSMCPKLGECKRRNCPYAHSREELRSTECFAKTKVCFGSCENCRFGGNCRYAHSVTELKASKDLPTKIMANIKGKKKAPPLQSLKDGDAKRGIKLIHSKAKGDFDAETYGAGYIDLEEGDYVAIVKDDEDGWMYGKNFSQDTIGWFPTSYVMDDDEEGDIVCHPADEMGNIAPQFGSLVPDMNNNNNPQVQ